MAKFTPEEVTCFECGRKITLNSVRMKEIYDATSLCKECMDRVFEEPHVRVSDLISDIDIAAADIINSITELRLIITKGGK